MTEPRADILQGTLDLMVLKTLDSMGAMHGYGIARRIEQISAKALAVNQGTIYLCLIRLVQKKWISAAWGSVGKQPQSQVLHNHQSRPQAARGGNRKLGTRFRSHRKGSRTRAAEVTDVDAAPARLCPHSCALRCIRTR